MKPILSLVVVVCLSSAAIAADWHQWRGPNRDGVAPKSPPLIESLPENGIKPQWVAGEDIPSARSGGWSSPILADGKVYLFTHAKAKLEGEAPKKKFPWLPPEKRTGMSDAEYEQYEKNRRDEDEEIAKFFRFDELTYCLDAGTGKLIWKNERKSVYTRFAQSGSPAVVDGRLYVLGAGRVVRCINANDGKDLWQTKLPGEFRDEYLQSSFAIAGGVATVLANSAFGLDAADGKILWQTEQDAGNLHTSPVVFESKAGPLFVINLPGGETVCLEPKTGNERWRVESMAGHSTPIVVGDRLFTYGSSRKAGLRCYKIAADSAEEAWTYQRVADSGASPVVIGDYVYAQGERRLSCVSIETGDEQWMTDLDISNPRYTSLAAADGKVFYAFDGVLCFAADPADFRLLMNAKVDSAGLMNETDSFRKQLKMDELEKSAEGQKEAEKLWREKFNNAGPLACASPAIADGKMYLRLKNGVACYDLRAARTSSLKNN